MPLDFIKNLASLLSQYNLSEIDYQSQDFKVLLKKEPPSLSSCSTENSSSLMNHRPTESLQTSSPTDRHFVLSPLIGTFYRAIEPGAAPFAQEGQKVSQGDPIGLIEAMKVLTLVYAPCDGIIQSFLADNGEMVEFEGKIAEIRKSK